MPEVVETQNNPESQPKPERLSDEEMGNLLSAFGNHEAKAIVLGLMGDGRIYTSGDLYRTIISAQRERPGWRMHHTIPFKYCQQTLSPIGLVTREIANPDLSVYGYQISNYGRRVLPFVGLLLNYSQNHEPALVGWFGSTMSTSKGEMIETVEGEEVEFKKRASILRFKIFYELVTTPNLPIRLVDLAERVKESGDRLSDYLVELARQGLIQYQVRETNKPTTYYRFSNQPPEGNPPIYQHSTALALAVFSILKEYSDEYLTREDIFNFLPDKRKEGKVRRGLLRDISGSLSYLAKYGYADIKQFKWNLQSAINLSDDQRIVLTELVEIVDRFQNQDPEILEQGEKYLSQILSDPGAVSSLMAKAREASSAANALLKSDTTSFILSIINSYPQGITNQQIRTDLEEFYRERLGQGVVNGFTRNLQAEGLVASQSAGNLKKFFPKPVD